MINRPSKINIWNLVLVLNLVVPVLWFLYLLLISFDPAVHSDTSLMMAALVSTIGFMLWYGIIIEVPVFLTGVFLWIARSTRSFLNIARIFAVLAGIANISLLVYLFIF